MGIGAKNGKARRILRAFFCLRELSSGGICWRHENAVKVTRREKIICAERMDAWRCKERRGLQIKSGK